MQKIKLKKYNAIKFEYEEKQSLIKNIVIKIGEIKEIEAHFNMNLSYAFRQDGKGFKIEARVRVLENIVVDPNESEELLALVEAPIRILNLILEFHYEFNSVENEEEENHLFLIDIQKLTEEQILDLIKQKYQATLEIEIMNIVKEKIFQLTTLDYGRPINI